MRIHNINVQRIEGSNEAYRFSITHIPFQVRRLGNGGKQGRYRVSIDDSGELRKLYDLDSLSECVAYALGFALGFDTVQQAIERGEATSPDARGEAAPQSSRDGPAFPA